MDGVPLEKLLRAQQYTMTEWRSMPLLWKSGLDIDGLRAMLTLLELVGPHPRLRTSKRDLRMIPFFEILLARLVDDTATQTRLTVRYRYLRQRYLLHRW